MQFGALRVKTSACYTRPSTEAANTDAFVEVDEITLQGEVKRIFSGWMYAASPGLHGVEHPVYDIWLTDCKGPDQTIVSAAARTAETAAAAAAQKRPPPPKQAAPRPPPPAAIPAATAAATSAAAAAAGRIVRRAVRRTNLREATISSARAPLSGYVGRQLQKIGRLARDRAVEQRRGSAGAGFRPRRSCADAR